MLAHFRNHVVFHPRVDSIAESHSVAAMSVERSIQSSTVEWAEQNATPIVRSMLAEVTKVSDLYNPPPGYHWVLDVRVQRLMPGMYASIPGWHCDGIPRADYHAQPNLEAINRKVRHFVMTASTGGVAQCEFLRRACAFTVYPTDPVWQQVHRLLTPKVGDLDPFELPDGVVAEFGQDSLHRATPVKYRGWRIFLRLSQMITPPLGLGFAPQQQVYLVTDGGGW